MTPGPDYHGLTAWLDGLQQPLLVTHRRPDGDAVGALAALSLALRRRGLTPLVALFEPFPERYHLLRPAADWRDWRSQRNELLAACDALIVVDTCSLSQLEPLAPDLPRAPRTLVLDHHATRDGIGTRPGDLRAIDETASAVCLLIAEWLRVADVPLDAPLATALFVGIATDCGWFRFANTDARTLRIAADLLDAGAAASEIYVAVYQQDPLGKVRLIARMLASLELRADGRLAVMYLRHADFAAAGADHAATEDLINEAARLRDTEATLLFTEEADHVRVNFRSRRWLDVAALARRFGGGGHARAAGARLFGPWDQVVPPTLAAVVAALQR